MTDLPITPETKVGDLLSTYPELESVLIAMAPAFEKLKNPILRRTVARVATLAQAAKVAGMQPRELVGRLREAAGQPVAARDESFDSESGGDSAECPPWARELSVAVEFDADALLAAGQHPISNIQPRLATLNPGEQLVVRATFVPVPLVDALKTRYRVFVEKTFAGETLTHVALRDSLSPRGPCCPN